VDRLEVGGEALVLPEFAAALEALGERDEPREPAPTVVQEIVLECPVVIEFVGEDVSTAAAEALTTSLLDGLAGVVRDA
jgi:hypothetical protein